MADDLAGRAHALFTRALGADRAEREAIVRAGSEGQPDLESRVRRLLSAADRASGFLESPALSSTTTTSDHVPDAVGDYTVIGVLGVGGMAAVYEAVQDNPRRRVALKVMHHSMSHTDAYLRFRLETQTLARLHHPGIAQIYEAGTANLGRPTPSPFFAMELVPDAVTITEYARKHGLTLRQRVTLFASICDAVLHGHQNGVIHRDIKPGNVLVGPSGQPKVIDFGIARSTDASAPSLTTNEDARRLIGTLNYMSPEQCTDAASIDVRADVYALGVLLFELVTGQLPHELSSLSIPRAVQVITQDPIPKASTLCPEAAGDLDAIIAMATDKDPSRRYSGAGTLAADVRRWLSYRPIEARRPTTLEQIARFARRNPPLTAAIAASLAILVGASVISGTLAHIAIKARDASLQRERELEIVTDFHESLLRSIDVTDMGDKLRDSLQSSVEQAIAAKDPPPNAPDAADALRRFNALMDEVNFTTLAARSLQEGVLQRYHASIHAQFADQPHLRARLLFRLANTMNSLGLRQDAEPVLREALELRRHHLGEDHEDTLQLVHALGSLLSLMGRYEESERHLIAAHKSAARIKGPDDQVTLRNAGTLAGLYRRMGRHAEAERLWTATLEAQRRTLGPDHPDTLQASHNIGVVYAVQGRLDEAEAIWRDVIERRRRTLGTDSADYRNTLDNLGVLLMDRGRFAEATPILEDALAFSRRRFGNAHPTTLISLSQLASLRHETNDLSAAAALLRECVNSRREVLGPEHADTLGAAAFLGAVLAQDGRTDEGLILIRDSLAAQQRTLGRAHPKTLESMAFLRDALRHADQISEALRVSQELQDLLETADQVEQWTLGVHLAAHGHLLALSTQAPEGLDQMQRGYDLIASCIGPDHPRARDTAHHLEQYFSQAYALEPSPLHAEARDTWAARAKPPTAPDVR